MAGETEVGFVLNLTTIIGLIVAVAGGVWRLAQIEKSILDAGKDDDEELRTDMDAKFENVARDIFRVDRDNVGRAEIIRNEVGEMGSAIRQKIHEIEVYTRDTFVTRQNFETAMSRIERSVDKLGDRLEAKIDSLQRD